MKKILAIMFLLIPVTCLAEVKSQVKNNYDNVWDKMAKLASANNSCSVDADCKLQKFNSLDVKPKEIKNGQASAILYSTKMPENKLKEFNDLVAKYNNSAKTSLEKAYMPNLTLKCEKNACAFNTDTIPNAVKKTNDKNITSFKLEDNGSLILSNNVVKLFYLNLLAPNIKTTKVNVKDTTVLKIK